MAISKIILNGVTQMDLTQDTVIADKLRQSYTAHGADGEPITGTATEGGGIVYQDENGYIVLEDDGGTYAYFDTEYDYHIYYPTTKRLVNSWDLTNSLVDTISGQSITLGGSATQDSSGVHLTTANDYATLPVYYRPHMSYEFDFGTMAFNNGTTHGRLIMMSNTEGLIYRGGATWESYLNGSWSTPSLSPSSDGTVLANKTLSMVVEEGAPKFYLNGTLWYEPNRSQSLTSNNKLMVGSAGAQSFFNTTITGIRVYWGG